MKPSRELAYGERIVLYWFLFLLAGATIMFLLVTWWTKSRDCRIYCTTQNLGEGTLRFHGGGRINMGTYCECEGRATHSSSAEDGGRERVKQPAPISSDQPMMQVLTNQSDARRES